MIFEGGDVLVCMYVVDMIEDCDVEELVSLLAGRNIYKRSCFSSVRVFPC